MVLNLTPYTGPDEFAERFDHNLKEISGIEDDELFKNFSHFLSEFSGIDDEIVLLDIKRHLMNNYEYRPHELDPKLSNMLLIPYVLLSLLGHLSLKKKELIDVLIDDICPEAIETFYGRELVSGIEKDHILLFASLRRFRKSRITHIARFMPGYLRCYLMCRRITKKHGVDLRRYLSLFFLSFIYGLALREDHNPKLVVSGDDNGISVIKAKAAGCKILLIQNGLRGYTSDGTFKYCDHYIAMGGKKVTDIRKHLGCVFKNTYYFGSLRLHNFLMSKEAVGAGNIVYDMLFVDSGFLLQDGKPNYDGYFKKFYPLDAELELIKRIKNLAETCDLKIAHHCRENEKAIEDLKKLGLFSEKITYLLKKNESVYEASLSSGLVASAFSTVGLEAMALHRTVVFINLSGNKYVNYLFRDLGIEYTEKNKTPLVEYLNVVRMQEKNYGEYITQNSNYVYDLIAIVKKELSQND
jgi:hypothetical protein